MKSSILAVMFLFCTACSLSADAQAQQLQPVMYSGAKFLEVHWVLSVGDRGRTVILEDSSVWTVCPHCRSTVARWLPGERVLIGERGDSYQYSYYLSSAPTAHAGYRAYAMCVKN